MPIYEYFCNECMKKWQQFHKIKERHNEMCCDIPATLLISKTAKPVVIDRYSENADIYFTGPKQRDAELRKKGLTSVESGVTKEGGHPIWRKHEV